MRMMSGLRGRGEVDGEEEKVEDAGERRIEVGEDGGVGNGTASLRNSRASRPLETAETEKLSFLISRMAICWLISSGRTVC